MAYKRIWSRLRYWTILGFLAAISLAASQSTCTQTPTLNQPAVPDAVAPGGPSFTLTVNGDQFSSGSTIHWNGTLLSPTGTQASNQMQATVPASLIATPGTATITVQSGEGGGASNPIYFSIWSPATTSSFITATGSPIAVGVKPAAAVVADFNGDGKPDLAVANNTDGTVTILLGNGDGTFTPAAKSPIAVGAGPDALVVGDFNVDGKPDLAVANGGAGTVSVLLGNGDGTFTAASGSPVAVGTTPDALAVADFSNSGHPSLAVANAGSNSVMFLPGNGDGTFGAAVITPVGTAPSAITVGDFNNSGDLGLAVANSGDGTVTILLGNASGTPFSAAAGGPVAVGTAPSALAVADVNGDGNLDIAVANSGSNSVTVLLGNGTGGFAAAGNSPISVGTAPSAVAIADFNTDNKLDIAVTNSGDSTATVLLGAGDGTFTAIPTLPTTGIGPASLAVADYNGDGRLDLATVNATDNTASILLQPLGVAPSVSSLSFVQQGLNSTSAAQTVTITNNTTSPVTLSTIGLTGTNTADFNALASGSTCSTSTPVPAGGGTCTINVTFTPTTPGTLTASLSIATNSSVTSSLSVALTGQGFNGGEVALTPGLTFGLQVAGTTSNPQIATLSNVGAFPVNISSITTSLPQFVIVAPTTTGVTACQSLIGSALAIGAQCVIPISFAPTTAGTLAASVSIADDAALSPQTTTLTGSGTNVQFTPAALTFGGEPIGTTGSAETVTVKNAGTTPLAISGIAVSSQFSIASGTTCSTSAPLAAGAACAINVTFSPTTTGSVTGALTITDTDPSSPQEVVLTGTGQDFAIQANTSSQSVQAGGGTSYSFSVAPEFGFTGTVALACSGAPANSSCTVTPNSVTLNGTSTVGPTLSVATTGSSLVQTLTPPSWPRNTGWPMGLGLLLGMGGLLLMLKQRQAARNGQTPQWRWVRLMPLAVTLWLLILAASCGKGPTSQSFGTLPGTYTLTITGTSGNLSHSSTVTLVVH